MTPRHLPSSARRLDRLGGRTIEKFGAEWLAFRDWGFHEEERGADPEYQGGLWSDTLRAFASKTLLEGQVSRSLCLDAGCGNGRFTAAAVEHGAREVISVDLGWGVEAAFERFRENRRVHVVQASLFELPVRRVEVAFSIGVLMHTGDARAALASIAACIGPGGLLAVRMYHRGNWAYEGIDRAVRSVTTRLGPRAQERFAARMARLGRWLMERDARRPGTRMRWYRLLRNWPTVHHNVDWWTAPVATHHTTAEVAAWGEEAGLAAVRSEPGASPRRYGFWEWPEALTILFQKPLRVMAVEPKPLPAERPAVALRAAG